MPDRSLSQRVGAGDRGLLLGQERQLTVVQVQGREVGIVLTGANGSYGQKDTAQALLPNSAGG